MRRYSQYVIFFLYILSMGYGHSITKDLHSLCGDSSWVAYEDEKCFKLINEFTTYDKAEKICNQELLYTGSSIPTLVSIKSEAEQKYLNKFVFEQLQIMDNVWISAKRPEENSNLFLWNDNSLINYTNWAEGSPINEVMRNCVEIRSAYAIKYKRSIPESSKGDSKGNWFNVPCKKSSLILCQKLQIWSNSQLQKTLLDARNEMRASLKDVRMQLKNHDSTFRTHESIIHNQESKLDNIEKNPVPINFIYVQLPNQAEPSIVWPKTKWRDISSNYAGLFFRVLGGGSAAFGVEQNENSPRITDVQYGVGDKQAHYISVLRGQWSKRVKTGGHVKDHDSMRFFASGGEVRPRNKAYRIWIRFE